MFVIENENSLIRLKRQSSRLFRFIILACGLVPLITPYELIIKPDWNDSIGPFFLISLLIAIGSFLISVFFILFALAGLNETFEFDFKARNFIYSYTSPVLKLRRKKISFSKIHDLKLKEETQTDGPNQFRIQIVLKDERDLIFGDFTDQQLVENLLQQITTQMK